jgi:hypothetical protein
MDDQLDRIEAKLDLIIEYIVKSHDGKPQRGSRLPADWQPSADELAWCMSKRPDLDPDVTAEKFKDYWTAVPGQRGRKVSWTATWRTWVRNEKAPSGFKSIEQQNAETLRRLVANA